MIKVLGLMTCFNRKEKTVKAINSLISGNIGIDFDFIVTDDNSSDGTREALKDFSNVTVLVGDGNLFYSGGMNRAMSKALEINNQYDYCLLFNDDVDFYENSIEHIIRQSKEHNDAVVIGATCDDSGLISYGAIKYIKGYKYRRLDISESDIIADTFNANCVLVPYEVFKIVGVMDGFYKHSLGDFDYGLSVKRSGSNMYSSKSFVGVCNNNSTKGTWTDNTLSIKERIKKKESIKGAPTKQWFYFLKKNFGLTIAVKGVVTPYIRIFTGK